MALLDTTALIDLSRSSRSANHQRAVIVVRTLLASNQTICTSRINEAEFRLGGFLAADPKQETSKIEAFLSTIVILEFDGAAAIRFAQMQAHLLSKGRPTGSADTLIAAIAAINGQAIVTRNPRDFAGIPSINVISY